MDNQHREIRGYRELNAADIAQMNEVKDLGQVIEAIVNKLRTKNDPATGLNYDQHWVSIGATHLQEGLMALTRAIAKPTFF